MLSTPRPGPKGVVLLKIMRRSCFHRVGGRVLGTLIGLVPCRGARWALLILRKQAEISGELLFPTDASCARRPWGRAIQGAEKKAQKFFK
jgi:hypothetical protein